MIRRFLDWRQNRKTDRFLQRILCLSGEHQVLGSGFCLACKRDLIYSSPQERREYEAMWKAMKP